MKRAVFALFLWYLMPYTSLAQQGATKPVDSKHITIEFAKEDTNEVNRLYELVKKEEDIGDLKKADSLARKALELANKISFLRGKIDAYNIIGNIYDEKGDFSQALRNYSIEFKISEETDYKNGMAMALCNEAIVYTEQCDIPNTLNTYLRALKIAEQIGKKNYLAGIYGNIGAYYSSLNNYPDALKNQLMSLKINEEINDKRGIAFNYLQIGKIYADQEDDSNALKNDLQSLEIVSKLNDKLFASQVHSDIGAEYTSLGNYTEALKNEFEYLNEAKEIGAKSDIGYAYILIGQIYGKQSNYKECIKNELIGLKIAEQIDDKSDMERAYLCIGKGFNLAKKYRDAEIYLDSGLAIAKETRDMSIIEESHAALSQVDIATGDYKAAYEDNKLYVIYRDSIKNEEGTKKLVSEQLTYEFEKKEAQEKADRERVEVLKAAANKRKNILVFGVIILLVLTAGSIIGVQQVTRKKEKAIMVLEKKLIEEELLNAQKVLNEYTMTMVEKNELLEQFKIDMEGLKILKSKELEEARTDQLEHLNKTTILTDEDWDKFKGLFEQVHKGFLIRLKEKMPDLTQAEIRLFCLTKLKVDTKHMAKALGVSYDTVIKTRYRLRKKMGLNEGDSIDDLTESI